MPALKVSDHREIVEFCIRNVDTLAPIASSKTAPEIIREARKLAKGQKIGRSLSRAGKEAQDLHDFLRKSSLKDKYWAEGLPVLGRIVAFDGSLLATEAFLRREASRLSEPLRAALRTTADIIEDGANTIYSPEYWIVAQVYDPRGYYGAVSQAWRDMVSNGSQKIKDIAAGDLVGGGIGGIAGAGGGAAKGSLAGGGGAAAGAFAGAVAGAVSGAIAGSIKAATA
jgi:hypothetical protein